jgi:tetratricopeptide (TPR) repeat protein
VLALLRVENWFIGTFVAALLVAGASALTLQAKDPARTVAVVILIVAISVAVIAIAGWIIASRKEDRVFDQIVMGDVVELMDRGRWDEAVAKLEVEQASSDPDRADTARNLLADCYASTGRNAEAEAMIRRSIDARGSSNENLGEQLTCLAVAVRRQGRNEEAEELFTRALGILKKGDEVATVFAMRNLAYLYWTTGRQDLATTLYHEMPEVDPEELGFLIDILKPFAEPLIPNVERST